MRLRFGLVPLSVVLFASLGPTPAPTQACDPVFYRGGFYYTARPVYYSQAYPSAYYAPRVYHVGPMTYQQPSGQQQSYAPARPQAEATTSATVGLRDDRFEPAALTVAPGTTVRWMNHGQHKHTVTSTAGHWDSGDLGPGQVYSATFTKPGTYEYHCRHHKEMRGTIVVK
jgi:plastocyanin